MCTTPAFGPVRLGLLWSLGLAIAAATAVATAGASTAGSQAKVDTALVLAVDVSDSVDEERYHLQMEGIAEALEDPAVIRTITGGPRSGIMLAMVVWADHPHMVVPWTVIRTREDALAASAAIRAVPHQSGEFTCMARMMNYLSEEVVPGLAARATRVVVDVSGDGADNCNSFETTKAARDGLVRAGAIVNGLPIIEPGEDQFVGVGAYRAPGEPMQHLPAPTNELPTRLEPWYKTHVVGGDNAFVEPARGFKDFARAFRRKFIIEISGVEPGGAKVALEAR